MIITNLSLIGQIYLITDWTSRNPASEVVGLCQGQTQASVFLAGPVDPRPASWTM